MKRALKQYHYSHWDEGEINALMRLRGKGKSTAEIAEALGRTNWAVANVIYWIRKGERYADKKMSLSQRQLRQAREAMKTLDTPIISYQAEEVKGEKKWRKHLYPIRMRSSKSSFVTTTMIVI